MLVAVQPLSAQFTNPDDFEDKLSFFVANDLGRNGYYDQKPIAETMGRIAEVVGPEFVLAAGDVHHFEGVQSVNDPLWMTNYELIYSHPELMIDWFPICGNHEYRGNTQAVIDYSNVSRRWEMPSRYYTKAFEEDGVTLRVVWLDTTPLIDKYRKDAEKYPDAGWGFSFAKWLKAENPQPYQSFGNGAAMRVSPVGEYARSEEEAKRLSRIVTAVSHDHPEGLKGAECVAMCVYLAKNGAGKEQIFQRIKEEYYPEIASLSCENLSKVYTFDESCRGTVPQALTCFFEGKDFEDTIRNAISIGGDSDTVAAIAGGVAEAFFGIPTALIDVAKLYLDDDLLQLAENIENEWKKNG